MKSNKLESRHGHNRIVIASIAIILLALASTAVIGFGRLRDLWLEQCLITDYNSQVEIVAGKMVKADVIANYFGLKNGANIALIDFATKRADILRNIPNLRDIRIERKLPNKLKMIVEERQPVARLSIKGRKTETGKVVDSEGVVFMWQRGTRLLPVIREGSAPGTSIGHELTGHARAALLLLETCRNEPKLQELGILEVDASKHDFLTATLSENYSIAKIAWEDMDSITPASQASIIRQLTMLLTAIQSHVGDGAVVWNATDTSKPGRIYADFKGKLK